MNNKRQQAEDDGGDRVIGSKVQNNAPVVVVRSSSPSALSTASSQAPLVQDNNIDNKTKQVSRNSQEDNKNSFSRNKQRPSAASIAEAQLRYIQQQQDKQLFSDLVKLKQNSAQQNKSQSQTSSSSTKTSSSSSALPKHKSVLKFSSVARNPLNLVKLSSSMATPNYEPNKLQDQEIKKANKLAEANKSSNDNFIRRIGIHFYT